MPPKVQLFSSIAEYSANQSSQTDNIVVRERISIPFSDRSNLQRPR